MSTDIWDRLGIECGGYNQGVDKQIFNVARLIVEAHSSDKGSIFCTDIAEKLELSVEHVELIQYILASVEYPDHTNPNDCPFEYGTSPRGLFVGNPERAEQFIKEFEEDMLTRWNDD